MKVPDLASFWSTSVFWTGCGHNGACSPCWRTSNGATFSTRFGLCSGETGDSPILPIRTLSTAEFNNIFCFSARKATRRIWVFYKPRALLFSSAFPFCRRRYVPSGSSGWARVSRPDTRAGAALVETAAHRFTLRAARQRPNELL